MSERITGHTELLTLMAYPIRHSQSPAMHNEAAAYLGLDYAYLCFDVDQSNLKEAIAAMRALKVRGGNLSMPNKIAVIPYLDRLSEQAQMCGAVNTIVNDDGVLTGHITDGIGYMRSLKDSGVYILRSALGGVNSYPLLAIPMFVLSGIIMSKGGVSKKLFEVFSYFVGRRTAGIPCAVVVTCLFFGAISGSAPATVAAVGSMTIPLMLDMGYDKKFSVALVAVAGGLGVIIPPSIPFILYAQATGASVSDMFLAGIVPGILIAVILMGYAYYHCRKHGEDREKIETIVGELHSRGFRKVFFSSFFALLTPVIILGCIYSGVTSPTEAAVIAVFYSLIISMFVYKTLKPKDLWGVLREAVRTFCPILFILAASVAFSRILTLMHVPQSPPG